MQLTFVPRSFWSDPERVVRINAAISGTLLSPAQAFPCSFIHRGYEYSDKQL